MELKIGFEDDTMASQGSDGMRIQRPIDSPIEQRNTAKGNPNGILQYARPLSNRQSALLEQVPTFDSRATVRKRDVNLRDLSALTAETGDEFALFTKGSERLVIRGDAVHVAVTQEAARQLAEQGYRWSGHTHPGYNDFCLSPSDGDLAILEVFHQKQSVIGNSKGVYLKFWR